jgi:hypothetical protein
MPGAAKKDNIRKEPAGTAAVISQLLRRLFGVLASGFEELRICSRILFSKNVQLEELGCRSLSSAFDLWGYADF